MEHGMTTRWMAAVLACAVLFCAPLSTAGQEKGKTAAAELAGDSKAALQQLYATVPLAKELGPKALAILVFPEVTKAGLGIGGQYGEGALLKSGKPAAYYKTTGASFGLQAGAQKYGYAMFFMNAKALGQLDAANGFEVGVGPSVVLIDEGKARTTTTTTMKDDVYAFVFGQKGLMAGLGIQGNKSRRSRRSRPQPRDLEGCTMKFAREFITSTLVGGLFIVVPVYLAVLLLLKGMKSAATLVRPFAALLPDWIPAELFFSLLLVLALCFLVGAAVRTRTGRAVRERMEVVFFERLPGYGLLRSLTQRLAGDGDEHAWKPALIDFEDALVPGFIIEEHGDGRLTVFVPSVPTPFAGAVYVLSPDRVHPLDIPFTQAIQSISRWGSGSKDLVAAMRGSTLLVHCRAASHTSDSVTRRECRRRREMTPEPPGSARAPRGR